MKILNTINALQNWRKSIAHDKSVGIVPTMGALHDGHRSLIARCRRENDICVISIFVNPTQFNDPNDLATYPVTFEEDRAICEAEGVDAIFMPQYGDLYPDDYRYRVSEDRESCLLCGAHRAGHFDGVLSVVMKLFNLAQPRRAYFGEKDWQQLQLVKGMVDAFFMPVSVVACPTVRETDNLALSSRNRRLSSEHRKKAARFPHLLSTDASAAEVARLLKTDGFKVDYVEDFKGRRCAAIHCGGVRLIDNLPAPETED
ncbi:pantothenate synthetase [Desulfosarcina ovata subsp. sediminis]|uniref:Pantothenate synthetase n=1 Tax=Desulfosarcina ovata subsp. sediminis TaxID=885957 RepID=A0A5K7ZSU4_9BACT|nr:pantoate--beta-alanine ligase [Desulfosarcina ovata]BBO83285.1 pantothenate synthetase [Desulfosarcina ovata subsp. sediminis]